ncbi:MAG: hypothetical protein R1F54_08510 [Candidatus Zeuxoniibacter abyssi]|nr:MAG: hypothetical protein R1F54_08510 [Candidatus Persebacteraceae bacterium AB1(2)]
MKIWVLDSGLQGDRAQILGLAEALARKTEATISSYDVSVRAWAKLLPKPASYFVKRRNHERPTKGRM